MLYSEFAEGTGCRDTEHNHGVYERVEKMYMSDENMTKEEAYKIAALWIDNSLSEEQEEQNRQTEEHIAELKQEIAAKEEQNKQDKALIDFTKDCIKERKQEIAVLKDKIRFMKTAIIK